MFERQTYVYVEFNAAAPEESREMVFRAPTREQLDRRDPHRRVGVAESAPDRRVETTVAGDQERGEHNATEQQNTGDSSTYDRSHETILPGAPRMPVASMTAHRDDMGRATGKESRERGRGSGSLSRRRRASTRMAEPAAALGNSHWSAIRKSRMQAKEPGNGQVNR